MIQPVTAYEVRCDVCRSYTGLLHKSELIAERFALQDGFTKFVGSNGVPIHVCPICRAHGESPK